MIFKLRLALALAAGLVASAPGPARAEIGDRFIYFPAPYPIGDWKAERVGGLPFEDRLFEAADGVRLHGWWVPREGARVTVLYLHGNGGNLTFSAPAFKRLWERLPANVFAIDYRGYGRSQGPATGGGAKARPSEQGLYRDAEAAFAELTGPLGVRPEDVVIHGHSLGAAVATELALRVKAAALVLEAPFTSMPEMVRLRVPLLDPESLVSERYDNLAKAARLEVPLLVVHGTRDRTIPVEMGRAVFDAAPEPKSLLVIEGAGHGDCSLRGGDELLARVRALVARAVPSDRGRRRGGPALY